MKEKNIILEDEDTGSILVIPPEVDRLMRKIIRDGMREIALAIEAEILADWEKQSIKEKQLITDK